MKFYSIDDDVLLFSKVSFLFMIVVCILVEHVQNDRVPVRT